MPKELVGFIVIGLAVLTLVSRFRSPPDKDNFKPSQTSIPRFHLYKGSDDVDASLDVFDRNGQPVGRLAVDNGRLYDPKDGSIRVVKTPDWYLIKPQWDIGTFAGYRSASSGTESEPFTVGLRLSPVRLFYDVVAPDVVIAPDWAGVGASAFLPRDLVGDDLHHLGFGAWYGFPYAGASHGDRGGWTLGLSLSIR